MTKFISTQQQANSRKESCSFTASQLDRQNNLIQEVWQKTITEFKDVMKHPKLIIVLILVCLLLDALGVTWFFIIAFMALVSGVAFLEIFITTYSCCKHDAEFAREQAQRKEIIRQKVVAQLQKEQEEREVRDKLFFALSATTCNRCGNTVKAHQRILDKAYYTCSHCRKSFSVKLYDPEKNR